MVLENAKQTAEAFAGKWKKICNFVVALCMP